MATGHRAARKKPTLGSDFSLLLRDINVVKLKSERVLRPDEAPEGAFTIEVGRFSLEFERVSGGASQGPVIFAYTISIEGYKTKDGAEPSDRSDAKSFSVEMDIEGIFQLRGEGTCKTENFLSHLNIALSQMHCVAIEKLRNAIADLGYRNVRPALGTIANVAAEGELAKEIRASLMQATLLSDS